MTSEPRNYEKLHDFSISVPGGLSGQIFAVCYGLWVTLNLGFSCNLRFYSSGTAISRLGVARLFEGKKAHELGLSYTQINGNLNWSAQKTAPIRSWSRRMFGTWKLWSIAQSLVSKLDGTIRHSRSTPAPQIPRGIITLEDLQDARYGSDLIGYPSDTRVVEAVWKELSELIAASGEDDFTQLTGLRDSVAIHWRLGDFLKSPVHGSVSWESLEQCLYASGAEETASIYLYTDSPETARSIIKQSGTPFQPTVVSKDIWSDLYMMTRSRIFIGSNSAVSLLAAMSLRADNSESQTWLPDSWYRDPNLRHHDSGFTFEGSRRYPVEFL